MRILNVVADSQFLILTYHRVLPKSIASKETEPGMFVTPETFRRHLSFLKLHFDILPLSTLTEQQSVLESEHNRSKPACFITFDDGWRDLYQYAFPIIAECDVPATVFLPTGYIGSHRYFWSDIIYKAIAGSSRHSHKSRISDNPAVKDLLSISRDNPERIADAIAKLKSLPFNAIEEIIEELSKTGSIAKRAPKRQFVSLSEIETMRKSGLVAFGSHTVNHRILTTLSKSEIHREVYDSFCFLKEKKIVKENDFIPFCYPNGNHDANTKQSVMAAGYSAALTTLTGWNSQTSDLFALRRISLHDDMTRTIPLFVYKILHGTVTV